VTRWELRLDERLWLQLGLNGFEEPEAHRAVVACERDYEAHSPLFGSVGIARQRADTGNRAGPEEGAGAAAEQGWLGPRRGAATGQGRGP
jgi:hypothetical protein